MKRLKKLGVVLMIIFMLTGCSAGTMNKLEEAKLNTWEDVLAQGKNKEVTILMWGGNESVNKYMDGFVSTNLKEKYGITLKRVPMNAPEFMSKLLNEKKGNVDPGTADLVWINAENFRTAKQGGLLWGPFTDLLPNLKQYYDLEASDLHYDTGIAIEGHEAIWGRAQLVLTYDSAYVKEPPKSFKELMAWAKANPGKFTYPKLPDDFVGAAFIRTAYYELTGEKDIFQQEMTREEFNELSKPVVAYFKELNPYLWREGKAFPVSQAQQDELFKNGEVYMTMGFEIGKTAGQVKAGVYPESVKTYVFDTGTVGNSHYLAVPFNSPNKAAALLAIDFLQSPEAQLEKMKPEVWGDMPAFDTNKLDAAIKSQLEMLESEPASPSMEMLTKGRLPEMQAQYIDWIKEIWTEEIGG
ncbi:putative spermidine/putrescine transport system substrate-binding protein [Anaerosolibacter carboniphilus]|uniref:Putative spermidine/putrescine transport system substrate-binding protein n=1 Tax=Anaerosolibacter carboniphilus TaxID=1417629 RepID=A0A841KTM8_9FIRM|nr:ABC transporter substrate-binding protein [Anaerosolibacter carboniphilus]MBB6215518.1 putative spermidine/putrescine transport system substrate-binding protein [Anaerosolibacter carboniphilus]